MTVESWVSTEELAAHLGVSTQSILIWVKSGKIPGIKPGKAFRFRISEAEAALIAYVARAEPIQSPQSRGRKRLSG